MCPNQCLSPFCHFPLKWMVSIPCEAQDEDAVHLCSLDLFNAELSLERYWRGRRCQKMEGGRNYIYLSPPEWFCIKMGSDESDCNVWLIVRAKVPKPQCLKSKESGSEESDRCHPLTSLMPCCQAKTAHRCCTQQKKKKSNDLSKTTQSPRECETDSYPHVPFLQKYRHVLKLKGQPCNVSRSVLAHYCFWT